MLKDNVFLQSGLQCMIERLTLLVSPIKQYDSHVLSCRLYQALRLPNQICNLATGIGTN